MAIYKINLPDGKILKTKTKKKENLITKCPYHKEETPSFFINYENGDYYCLGCGIKGTGAETGILTETLEEHTQAFWEESKNEKSLFEKTTGEYKIWIFQSNEEGQKFWDTYLHLECVFLKKEVFEEGDSPSNLPLH